MSGTFRIAIVAEDGAACRVSAMRRDARAELSARKAAERAAREAKVYRPSDADLVSDIVARKTTD